ncbi:C45 family autoproteolytic acyltransferase/hydolase [Desulfovibrio inopinatus]|uniref:C45 family autoproteolytic acyltransferase/hydolase n=1 Tax=Desulfovibrio inopinatus TaxID=102109 RepID=UPI00041DA1CC|nr:C45 family peptidase [Desulfovibrio inopinatus]
MLNIVELKGSYYEIGVGWGKAFKNDMPNVVRIEMEAITAILGLNLENVIQISSQYMTLASDYDPDFMQVLRGFADGAEMQFETFFAIRTLLEVLFYSGRSEGMCTSFALTKSATETGETIIGQNIDWHPGLPMVLLKITWPNGVRQLTLSMGGIWEYGLSQYLNASPFGIAATLTASWTDHPDHLTVPISMVMNKAARQKNFNSALSVFRETEQNLASFLLANGDGELVGVELGLRDHEILRPENDILVHSNHYLSERFRTKDIFLPFVPDSPLRYQRLLQLTQDARGKITPETMMRFLSDHENYPKAICSHVDPKSDFPPSATTASIIMVPSKHVIHVAVGNPCNTPYIPYSL